MNPDASVESSPDRLGYRSGSPLGWVPGSLLRASVQTSRAGSERSGPPFMGVGVASGKFSRVFVWFPGDVCRVHALPFDADLSLEMGLERINLRSRVARLEYHRWSNL